MCRGLYYHDMTRGWNNRDLDHITLIDCPAHVVLEIEIPLTDWKTRFTVNLTGIWMSAPESRRSTVENPAFLDLTDVLRRDIDLVSDIVYCILGDHLQEIIYSGQRKRQTADPIAHGDDDIRIHQFDKPPDIIHAHGTHLPCGDEKEIYTFDPGDDIVIGNASEIAAVANGHPIHLEQVHGVDAELSTTGIIMAGLETLHSQSLDVEQSVLGQDIGVITTNRPDSVVIIMVVRYQDNVRRHGRGLDADGAAVVGVHNDGDIRVSELETGVSVPSDAHARGMKGTP